MAGAVMEDAAIAFPTLIDPAARFPLIVPALLLIVPETVAFPDMVALVFTLSEPTAVVL